MRWMCRNTFSRTCPESKPNTLYIGLKLCLSRDNLSPRVTIDVTIAQSNAQKSDPKTTVSELLHSHQV